MRRRSRALLSVSACVLGVACALGAARVAARRFLFPAHDLRVAEIPAGFTELRVRAHDGVIVRALALAGDDGAPTLVHFHTNRETVESAADLARTMRARGLGVVLVEYRGYGASREGTPSEPLLYDDAEAVLAWLASRGVGADRIVLSGRSLGTGIAAEMARRGRGARLVLVAPYTSIPDVVEDAAPFVPARLFLTDRFETLAKARAIHVPTLVVHGDRDEIVPFWMGERIAAAIPGALFRRVAGARHADVLARDPDVVDAIARYALGY